MKFFKPMLILMGFLLLPSGSAFTISAPSQEHIVYEIQDKDLYIGLQSLDIPNMYDLNPEISVCINQKQDLSTLSTYDFTKVPIKFDGVQAATFDIKTKTSSCFKVSLNFRTKPDYLVKLGFGSIDILMNVSNYSGLYSVGSFNSKDGSKNDSIVYGGTGTIYAYNLSGTNIWNYSFSTNANSKVYAMKPFYNGSTWLIPFMPYLNATKETFLYILNSSGSLICKSNDIVTGTASNGGGADLDIWDMDGDGINREIALLYDDGGRHSQTAGYYQNCTQLYTTTIATSSIGQAEGINTAHGAHLMAGDFDGNGFLDQYATYNAYATPSSAPDILDIINKTGGIKYTIDPTGSQSSALAVGNFSPDVGDEIVITSIQFAVGHVYNGTLGLKSTSPTLGTTGTKFIPVGNFGSLYDSFFMQNVTNFYAMFNGSFETSQWTVLKGQGETNGGAVADFNGDSLNDVCMAIDTKIHCWNYSGTYLGNFSVITGVGNRWGHYSIGAMKAADCGYFGSCLMATDTFGHGYLLNISGTAYVDPCEYTTGNWIIPIYCYFKNRVFNINGNLSITAGGTLNLTNVTLNFTATDQWLIFDNMQDEIKLILDGFSRIN